MSTALKSSALQSSIARLGNKLDEHKRDAIPLSLSVAVLTPYRAQARTDIDPTALRELADSIKDVGIIAPIFVRPVGEGRYEILAGERRWRAAQLAGLSSIPVLSKPMDDALADKIHLAENIQRENLSTLDLAQRVQLDLAALNGNLAAVAAKYSKGKSWVSKLAAIAQGGEAMADLVADGITDDRAVLATVASLERKAPDRAKVLTEQLKAAPAGSNKRVVAESFMQGERAAASADKKPGSQSQGATVKPAEPAWRRKPVVACEGADALIVLQLSPASSFIREFLELSRKYGKARLAMSARHPDAAYAVVQFGDSDAHRRIYRADELRLLTVS